jgi:xanthine/uracil permease
MWYNAGIITVEAVMGAKTNYRKSAWYRILQFLRVVAYGFGLLIAYVLSVAQEGYTYTNYANNTLVTVPDTPFRWTTFVLSTLVCVIVIELIESTVVYLFSGRSLSETIPEKFKALNNFLG